MTYQPSSPARYRRWISPQPTTLVIQPDSFCNLACTYCYLPDKHKRAPMSAEVAAAIATSATELASPDHPIELVWHAGEPLAIGVRRFTELARPFEPLRQAGLLQHYVQTNATLITDAWCDFLMKRQFRVGVSIDGPAALNTERVDRKGRPAFDRITRGISRLRERGIPFSVIAVVTTQAIGSPEALLGFLASLGCHTIGLNIEEIEGANTERPQLTIEQAAEFWRRTIAWARRNPTSSVREVARLGDYLKTLRTCQQVNPEAACLDPIPTVSSSGDVVLLSPELAGVTAPEYDDFLAGNVLSESIAAMLGKAHRLRYVDEFLTGLERCEAGCQFFDFCRGAQAGNRYFENGRLDSAETNYCRVSRQALITALSDTVREEQPE
ncbi:cyclophane-forming radical SAM peptide maturase AmcB [Kitasatospora azatica]|uniref:cyclophane-forming radical SAM peptide maturase AmcB n=1 Tax=Kitasatospora azatica TaxID=58347 RepID=UPI0005626379|nr:cyclophane-forming radical SAM peptide maturase AmcB [Kitasatospora azatica]